MTRFDLSLTLILPRSDLNFTVDFKIFNCRVFIYHFNIEYEIEQQSSVDEVLQAVYREMINSYSTTLPNNNIKRKF